MTSMLRSRLPQIMAELPVVTETTLGFGRRRIAEEARGRAPVETGALRDSITVEGDRVVVGVDYGGYVEHGTVRQAPEPFLIPAFEQERPRVVAEVAAELRRL